MLNQIDESRVDLGRVDLNLLVLFEAVMEARHVGRAADGLSLTPSAVSHGLGRLRRLLHDPLFLKTPKGVVPTARAAQLALPISDVLARVRSVVSTAEPFDPATSTRRFTIGAPDGASAVFLPSLLAALQRAAPGVDIGVRQLLPVPGETPERAWRSAWADLEARAMDIAVVPADQVPLRFSKQTLYEEDFVIAMRAGHPLRRKFSLDRYCEAQHLVVSMAGDPQGFVDGALAAQGRSRRVALTVPNFMFALAVIAGTDLVTALPRRFAAAQAARFGVVPVEAPLPLPRFGMNMVVPEVALMDGGVAWLVALLRRTSRPRSRGPLR
jgi:DNA-binding transcriptional LysR family regulator